MRLSFSSLPSKYAVNVCVLLVSLFAGSEVTHADTVHFAGSVQGDFGTVSASNPFSSTTTLNTLTYYGSAFNDTTSSSGFLAFGGGGTQSAATNVNNFGSFTLSNVDSMYSGNPFELMITFTDPGGITGGQSTIFNAIVFGSVSTAQGNGGVQVAFQPTSQNYAFSNGTQAGTFTLNLNNVAINPGQTASVTGYITANAVTTTTVTPEPSSLLLLGTGLIGTVGILRRKLVA